MNKKYCDACNKEMDIPTGGLRLSDYWVLEHINKNQTIPSYEICEECKDKLIKTK